MKILIVEDHQLFVEGLRIILSSIADEPQIFCANNAQQALDILTETPDIGLILMDIGLPDINGRALLKIFRAQGYEQPLLVVSGSESIQLAREMMDAGAQGYVMKASPLVELHKAIETVLGGDNYLPEDWKSMLGDEKGNAKSIAKHLKVTDRQLDVLYLLAQGHPNKIIADWLGVTEHTIKTHIQALFDVLNVHNRTACIREAERLGLLDQ
ncbi:MAG TPA: response regulator transcription factor [Gammaproteobacteria bacterium]